MYRTWCSVREGWSPPAPTLTVTSNHCPRLTWSGAATNFGVCFASGELRTCLYSGVNCSSCPAKAGNASPIARKIPRMRLRMGLPPLGVLTFRSELPNQLEQLAGAVRLGQVRGGAGVPGPLVVAAQRVGRDGDDGDLSRARIGAEPARRVEARYLWELGVHEKESFRLLE